jgi:DMSO/TMAO reductase YedYZ molybdopterin-dependent catalytic subunit
MVFNQLHWMPSAIAAVLTILLVAVKDRGYHKYLAFGMAFFALIGLLGYLSEGNPRIGADFHTFHYLTGAIALALSVLVFVYRITSKRRVAHHNLGYAAAAFALLSLVTGLLLFSGASFGGAAIQTPQIPVLNAPVTVTSSSVLPEVEATEFQGVKLTPLSQQGNNAITGTQHIDRSAYSLEVSGLVQNNLSLSYGDLLELPAYSEVDVMPCVEGWSFTAKWTGFRVSDLLNMSGLAPNATYVMFYSSDGYSTGETLEYLRSNDILLAYGINDVTLPADRGFPLQLVAKSKYGYKWGKWITKVVVGDEEMRGYWESRGYSNKADVGGPAYG